MTEPLAALRGWVEGVVVGLDLCPFAGAVVRRDAVAYTQVDAADPAAIAEAVAAAGHALLAADPQTRSTTLVAAPALGDFSEYLDVLALLEALFEALGLAGALQIASFHPDYRFADAPADDPANASNQAPVPVFHLLREDEVSRAVDGHPDVAGVPAANVARLRALGWAEIRRRRGW